MCILLLFNNYNQLQF
jgi:cullin 3